VPLPVPAPDEAEPDPTQAVKDALSKGR
jgi:hypothetical protein